jgi:hypothetical protein
MDRKIILSVLAAALMGFIGIWLLLSIIPDERAGLALPLGRGAATPPARTRVFDLSIGESTLADARACSAKRARSTCS